MLSPAQPANKLWTGNQYISLSFHIMASLAYTETIAKSSEKECLEASQRLAAVLGAHNEHGFEVYGAIPDQLKTFPEVATLRRMCIIQDQPKRLRKLASHCGGIRPNAAHGVYAFKDTPGVADPGNAIYAAFFDQLLQWSNYAAAEGVERWKLDQLVYLNAESKGDLVEASLAAANAVATNEQEKEWSWATLTGGACGKADYVTPFIERAVCWQCKKS